LWSVGFGGIRRDGGSGVFRGNLRGGFRFDVAGDQGFVGREGVDEIGEFFDNTLILVVVK